MNNNGDAEKFSSQFIICKQQSNIILINLHHKKILKNNSTTIFPKTRCKIIITVLAKFTADSRVSQQLLQASNNLTLYSCQRLATNA